MRMGEKSEEEEEELNENDEEEGDFGEAGVEEKCFCFFGDDCLAATASESTTRRNSNERDDFESDGK